MANKYYLDKNGLTYFWSKIKSALSGKQDTLTSGTNIKTVNSTSLLGSGNISIPVITVDSALSSSSTNPVQNKVINSALSGKASTSHTHTAASIYGSGSYLQTHPEDSNSTIIPFINNDLAFLIQQGGTCSVYSTALDADFTAETLTKVTTYSTNFTNLFDGSATYYGIGKVGEYALVVDITLPFTIDNSQKAYIDHGHPYWGSQNCYLYTKGTSETVYTLTTSSTKSSVSNYHALRFNRLSVVINKLRFVMTGFNSSWSQQIAELGLVRRNSTGLRATYMSRGIDDGIFRSITPNATETYSLGTSSKKWNNIYAKNIYGDNLATVATSGSYNDLSNKPTIPAAITVDSALSSTSTNPVQNKVIYDAIGNVETILQTLNSGSGV